MEQDFSQKYASMARTIINMMPVLEELHRQDKLLNERIERNEDLILAIFELINKQEQITKTMHQMLNTLNDKINTLGGVQNGI